MTTERDGYEALSTESGINFDQALGRNSSVHLKSSDGGSGRDFSGVLTSPFFGRPTSAAPPRRAEIGARVSF